MLLMLTDMRNFDTWLAELRPSIADYKYYVDFDKVFNNVEAIKIPLNILNLKSATTRLYDTEAKIICIVSKKGAQCIECHHKDI